MVIVDNNKNIQRIVDEVLADTDLFDNGATVGKLREVIFGDPEADSKNAIMQKPALYVTTNDSIQNSRYNFGYIIEDNQNQISVEYELSIIAISKARTKKSQKQLYDILKNLRKLADNNRRFADSATNNSPTVPAFWTQILPWDITISYSIGDEVVFEGIVYKANTANTGVQPPAAQWDAQVTTVWETGTDYIIDDNVIFNALFFNCILDNTSNDGDPIFSRSVINSVKWDTKTKGQLITSISVILLATIGESFTASFPGIGDLILLSKPNAPEGIVFSDNREQKFPNRVITNNGDFGAVFVEYESTVAIDDAFRAKFGVEEDITITSASGSKTYHIVYIDINPTAQFDAIERTVLHMEIIPV